MFERLERSEAVLIAVVAFFAFTGVAGMFVFSDGSSGFVEPETALVPRQLTRGDTWFESIHPYCNSVEVVSQMSLQPAPPTPEGDMYKAACFALAGRIDLAHEVIEGLPAELRYHAAGVVFDAGHPAADAGDNIAAGPLMELVVEYWPNHYMALYHAGAARFERGEYEAAEGYLKRFLVEYKVDDGWTGNARSMLTRIGER